MRQHAASEYLRLKAEFKSLVRRVGGVEAAASLTDVSAQRISEYGNPHRTGDWPRADVIMDLEAFDGSSTVSALMHKLSANTPCGAGYDPEEFLLHIQAEVGDVARVTIDAAADNDWTLAEYDKLLSEMSDVMELFQKQFDAISGARAQKQLRAVGE